MFKSSRSVGYFATGTKITSAVAREESCLQDKLTGLLITKSDLLQHWWFNFLETLCDKGFWNVIEWNHGELWNSRRAHLKVI